VEEDYSGPLKRGLHASINDTLQCYVQQLTGTNIVDDGGAPFVPFPHSFNSFSASKKNIAHCSTVL
jgi:hypothetical protein